MIALLGDIHNDFETLARQARQAHSAGAKALIQVGDFGFYRDNIEKLRTIRFPIPIYALDGNHEDHSLLDLEAREPVQLEQNDQVFYVPRGIVLDLDGRKIGCLGGAGSIDKAWRVREMKEWERMGAFVPSLWSEGEQITQEQEEYAMGAFEHYNPDFLVTHTPPQEVITECFDANGGLKQREAFFGVPPEWFDPSAHVIQRVWQAMNRPKLFCGHMHRSMQYETVRILNIDEMLLV
jgi:predicted phosphodiesterase